MIKNNIEINLGLEVADREQLSFLGITDKKLIEVGKVAIMEYIKVFKAIPKENSILDKAVFYE